MATHSIFRQGDVLLVAVAGIPCDAKPVPSHDGRVTLALGEITGHHHSIASGATLFRPDDIPASGPGGFVEIGASGALLTHQEHSEIALPPGIYRQAVQVEETPEATRRVED